LNLANMQSGPAMRCRCLPSRDEISATIHNRNQFLKGGGCRKARTALQIVFQIRIPGLELIGPTGRVFSHPSCPSVAKAALLFWARAFVSLTVAPESFGEPLAFAQGYSISFSASILRCLFIQSNMAQAPGALRKTLKKSPGSGQFKCRSFSMNCEAPSAETARWHK